MVDKTYLEESDGLSPENFSDSLLILAISVTMAPFRLINELSIKLLLLNRKMLQRILIASVSICLLSLLIGLLAPLRMPFSIISIFVYILTLVTLMALITMTFIMTERRFKALGTSERVMEKDCVDEVSEVDIEDEQEEIEESVMIAESKEAENSESIHTFDDPLMSYIGSPDDLDNLGVTAVDYMAAGFKRDFKEAITLDDPNNTVGYDFNIEME